MSRVRLTEALLRGFVVGWVWIALSVLSPSSLMTVDRPNGLLWALVGGGCLAWAEFLYAVDGS